MNNFLNNLEDEMNVGYTENNARAYKTTKSDILDLFSKVGVMREESSTEIENAFIKAFYEDKLLATKLLFYARDIREGLGERKAPRIILKYLGENYPNIIKENISLIPEYGRWDDLLSLFDTKSENYALDLIKIQFSHDFDNLKADKPVSLLGKWLPSINASSKETKRLAKKIVKSFGLTEKEYRQSLVLLRKKIDVVERKMSANQWTEIGYSNVPSKAMKQYRKAFERHDEGFLQWLEDVKTGKQKINAATLTPADIFHSFGIQEYDNFDLQNKDDVLEQLWENLPNYVPEGMNVLVMADTSGSMTWGNGNIKPITVSLSLAVYFAERNTGPYHNKFLTFDEKPNLVTLKGNDIYEKVRSIDEIVPWNTDFEAALDVVLQTAVNGNLSQDELPVSLVTISDMQFDQARGRNDQSFMDTMRDKYRSHGYEIPNMVFWNVASGNSIVHATRNEAGIQLVSGYSPTVFKDFINQSILGQTAYDVMKEILNSKRYEAIKV